MNNYTIKTNIELLERVVDDLKEKLKASERYKVSYIDGSTMNIVNKEVEDVEDIKEILLTMLEGSNYIIQRKGIGETNYVVLNDNCDHEGSDFDINGLKKIIEEKENENIYQGCDISVCNEDEGILLNLEFSKEGEDVYERNY